MAPPRCLLVYNFASTVGRYGLPRLLDEAEVHEYHGVLCTSSPLSESDSKEVNFWASDPLESYNGDLFANIVSKANYIKVFEQLIPRLDLAGNETILEIGGGHCWASALIKRSYPQCYVVASD